MVDFTGHACVNCRKMEEQVWSNTDVKNVLMNDVVLVSLYVDERIDLPLMNNMLQQWQEKRKKLKLQEISGWFFKQILLEQIPNHIMFS